MYILAMIVHVIVCIFLIIVVLLQSGKAADLAGAFGGMGSQTAFGPRGSATLLSKATTGSAIIFMITSLSLSIMATRRSGVGNTILDKNPAPVSSTTKPAAPAAPAQPTSVPVTINPNAPAQPGQPSVTLTDPTTGQKKTMPLSIPAPTGQAPPQAPAKK